MISLTIKFFSKGAQNLPTCVAQALSCGTNGVASVNYAEGFCSLTVLDMKTFGEAFRKTEAFLWSDFSADGAGTKGRN